MIAGKRILVVEDEPIVAMCLEDALVDMGCVVIGPAARLEDALALAQAGGIDAAVLDVNLGETTSLPVAALLAGRGTPFVFASGYDQSDLGGFPCARLLRKPYGADRLAAELGAALADVPPLFLSNEASTSRITR